jgi:hypothetical protein
MIVTPKFAMFLVALARNGCRPLKEPPPKGDQRQESNDR